MNFAVRIFVKSLQFFTIRIILERNSSPLNLEEFIIVRFFDDCCPSENEWNKFHNAQTIIAILVITIEKGYFFWIWYPVVPFIELIECDVIISIEVHNIEVVDWKIRIKMLVLITKMHHFLRDFSVLQESISPLPIKVVKNKCEKTASQITAKLKRTMLIRDVWKGR